MNTISTTRPRIDLEAHLRARRDGGAKLLVTFVTAAMSPDWLDHIEACIDGGADAVEIGIPFSDPMMDGPVIQESAVRALERGATPPDVLASVRTRQFGAPLVAMTAYNLAFRAGDARFAGGLAEAGFSGAILPDIPLEEAGDWLAVAAANGIAGVLLASTTADDARLARIAAASRGWVYGVGTLGVTGERATLAATATSIATRLKSLTDRPVLVGIGVSNAQQAEAISRAADGVIVGTSIVRRILEGASPARTAAFVRELRAGVDAASQHH